MTDAVLALERVAAAGWRAEEVDHLGGWLLRANAGFTMRANSVLPLGDPGQPLDDALAAAAAWYAARGLPLRATVPLPVRGELAAALDARGWERGVTVRVLVARLDDLATADAPAVAVDLAPRPSEAWLDTHDDATDRDLSPAGVRLLVRADEVAFATVVRDGRVVAIGRGTVVDAWLGLTAMHVDPHHRRGGLATAVVAALARWAGERGADRTYLQVAAPNHAAVGLYTRLGYADHHTYVHMTAPA